MRMEFYGCTEGMALRPYPEKTIFRFSFESNSGIQLFCSTILFDWFKKFRGLPSQPVKATRQD